MEKYKDIPLHHNGRNLPHVLYISLANSADITAWSGLVHNLSNMLLDQGFTLEYLQDLLLHQRQLKKAVEKGRAWFLGRKPVPVDRRLHTARKLARRIERQLKFSKADVVYSPSSIPMAFLETDRLKVFQTDATFAGIIHQYPELSEFPSEYMNEAHELERAALKNCDLAIYSSHWAANSAINDYGADPDKILVVPFGSNLGVVMDREQTERTIEERPHNICKLLFIGVHWERKGGDIALETANILHSVGVPVKLDIIGCIPPYKDLPPYVTVHPFIDKRKISERQRLSRIMEQSHFLLLPSRADCTPIVVNECNSLGVPCLTSDVGGLPEMIVEGVNGHLLKIVDEAPVYARIIQQYQQDRPSYEILAKRAFDHHQEYLGWSASGAVVREKIMELIRLRAA